MIIESLQLDFLKIIWFVFFTFYNATQLLLEMRLYIYRLPDVCSWQQKKSKKLLLARFHLALSVLHRGIEVLKLNLSHLTL